MKKGRIAAALLALLLFAMIPLGALAQESPDDGYQAALQAVLEELDTLALPEELPEEEAMLRYGSENTFDAPGDAGQQPEALLEDGVTENLKETTDELGGGQAGLDLEPQFNVTAPRTMDGSMYSQLNTRQKACYDALANLSIDTILNAASDSEGRKMVRMSITGITGLRMNGYIQGSYFVPTGSSADAEKSMYTDMLAAAVAVRYDMPEKLWVGDMLYGYRTEGTATSRTVTQACYYFTLRYGGQEKAMYSTMMEAARIIADGTKQLPDRYRKMRLVHDVLAEINSYNHPAANGQVSGWKYYLSHCAYSALVPQDEYEPVCDGYSKAFKIVCDQIDVPCALPSSATHMWNNVMMDDQEWYNLDLTWDDGDDSAIQYDYFLIGSETAVRGTPFCQQESHIEENPYTKPSWANNKVFTFPGKSKTAYEYLGQDYPPLRFSDVKRSAWYYDAIEEAADLGLFGGSGGKFMPTKNITRAEFAKAVTNLLQADLSSYTGSPFRDVPAGQWYAAPIGYVKDLGIMNGSGGSFRPNAPITREEMCVVLYNLAKKQGITTSGSQYPRFTDHNQISSWARDAVYACKELGLVQGVGGGNFSPKGNTQRCAAATVFVRHFNAMADAPNPYPVPTPTPSPSPSPSPDIDATVYWVPSGSVYHSTDKCPSLARSTTIYVGTVAGAAAAGKTSPCKVCH